MWGLYKKVELEKHSHHRSITNEFIGTNNVTTMENKDIEEIETEIRMAMIAAKSNPTAPKAEHYAGAMLMINQAITKAREDEQELRVDFAHNIATAMESYDFKTHESGLTVLTMINNLIKAEMKSMKN